MKGRVEAGDLQHVRLPLQDRADRGEVVGLVQGRERRRTFEPVEHRLVDHNRLAIVRPAMHDAMADRGRQLPADLPPQEGDDLVERRGHAVDLRRGPRLIDKVPPSTSAGDRGAA